MKIKANVSILSVILVIGILFTGCTNYASTVKEDVKDSKRTYDCDYHTLSLNTCISFKMDGETYKITGNIFRIVTDPLQLKDSKGNVVGYASDDYHVVSQDDHAIIIDGKFEVAIEGNFEILGNSYDIYGDDDVKLGKAEFNELCTSGAVLDNEGHAVAIYMPPSTVVDKPPTEQSLGTLLETKFHVPFLALLARLVPPVYITVAVALA